MAENFLTYKGRPMVRSKDTIYYGSTEDKYIVMIKINSTKDVGGTEVADKVTVQLISSDQDVPAKDRVIKKSDKNGLYAALDIGAIWLERALKSE
jgi:arginyl-tRNA synthetase